LVHLAEVLSIVPTLMFDLSRTVKHHSQVKLFPIIVLAAVVASGCQASERSGDLIHSDLPLWTDYRALWPRPFRTKEGFGCTHKIALGQWREQREERDAEEWIRLGNYGSSHCYLTDFRTYHPKGVSHTGLRYASLVDLGDAVGLAGPVHLWALQSGARPGSDYLLLASRRGVDPIRSFAILQRRCPANRVREGGQIDILLTRYCAINSSTELRDLARRMAWLPRLGRLQYIGPVPEAD
jgi:hypothetical protein